ALVITRRKATAAIDDPQKKPHKLELESLTLDLWDKDGDSWKLARTDQLSLMMKLDGKAMHPMQPKHAAHQAAAGPSALVPYGALMLASPIHPGAQRSPAPRAPAGAATERVTKVAQIFVTPYNYGWGGYGYGYAPVY